MATKQPLAVPWSLGKLLKRQAGCLFIYFPKGSTLSSQDGKRTWTTSKETRRVVGPDSTFTTLFTFEGDEGSHYVLSLSQEGSDLNYLSLLPVDENEPRSVIGSVIKLQDPVIFFPPNTEGPSFKTSHQDMIRWIWERAPEGLRRDLVREHLSRESLLGLPNIDAPMLLWLLGSNGMESLLASSCLESSSGIGLVCPDGASGRLKCVQVEKPINGVSNSYIHLVLGSIDGDDSLTYQIRLCLPYERDSGLFEKYGMIIREPYSEEKGYRCTLPSSISRFSQTARTFKTSSLKLAFFPGSQTSASGWEFLKYGVVFQNDVLKSIWGGLNPRVTARFRKLVDPIKTVQDVTKKIESILLIKKKDLGDWGGVFELCLRKWGSMSVFSRTAEGIDINKDIENVNWTAVLQRSYKMYLKRVFSLDQKLIQNTSLFNKCLSAIDDFFIVQKK
jgi:hypothetical protein